MEKCDGVRSAVNARKHVGRLATKHRQRRAHTASIASGRRKHVGRLATSAATTSQEVRDGSPHGGSRSRARRRPARVRSSKQPHTASPHNSPPAAAMCPRRRRRSTRQTSTPARPLPQPGTARHSRGPRGSRRSARHNRCSHGHNPGRHGATGSPPGDTRRQCSRWARGVSQGTDAENARRSTLLGTCPTERKLAHCSNRPLSITPRYIFGLVSRHRPPNLANSGSRGRGAGAALEIGLGAGGQIGETSA